MRARFFAQNLRRFVNSDVIIGSISNAVTLNRYAYANGNPVSNVDPFGLWSFKEAWNSFTNGVKEKIVESVVNRKQKTIKNIENGYLKYEDSSLNYPASFDNYEHNSKNDIVDKIIDKQKDPNVKKLMLGNSSMSSSGCEVIAVYNARIILGDQNVSLANTIAQFENQGALILQPFLSGGFGSNPYAIGKVLEEEGLTYSAIDGFEQMKRTPGVYIVSVWNSNEFTSMIHTIAIEIVDGEKPKMKNGEFDMDSETVDIFITGYKVSRK